MWSRWAPCAASVVVTILAASTIRATAGAQSSPATQAPQPRAAANDPDIYLATLSSSGGQLTVGKPVNITDSPGYDNQPFFTGDGRLLFASARGAAPAPAPAAPGPARPQAPPTDIYRYIIATQTIERVTNTPESEYSPTVTPDGVHISVVRVEADGTQRLWQFGLDGQHPTLLLADIKPVGYHAWIDANTLALFVLGQPATLQIADVRTGKAEIVARGIGRSILRAPTGGISFVRQVRSAPDVPPTYSVEHLTWPRTAGAEPAVLIGALPGSGDPNLAWTSDGILLTVAAGTLYSWRQGDRNWTPSADLGALGLEGVSRIAVTARGDRIALVAAGR